MWIVARSIRSSNGQSKRRIMYISKVVYVEKSSALYSYLASVLQKVRRPNRFVDDVGVFNHF